MTTQQDARTRRRVLLLVFIALFLLQQAALFWLYWGGGKTLLGDEVSYLGWARELAGLGPPVGNAGWWPPLQAWLLAGLLRLFGEHWLLPLQLLQTVFLIAAALLLRSIWRDVDGRVRAANTAAALLLLNPSTMAYAQWLWPEPLHLLLLLAAIRLAQHLVSPQRGALAGLALGGALLCKSLLSLFWPALLLLQGWRWNARATAALLLAVAAVIAVPLWQGWKLTGKPMIADSSAFNLVGGLEDRWRSDYVDDSVARLAGEYFGVPGGVIERNAAFRAKAEAIVHERGLGQTLWQQLEKQYFRLFSSKTLLLSQLPGPACAGHVGTYRQVPPLLGQSLAVVSDIFHLSILSGFALGLVFWRRWREPLVWWTALFFAYQLGLYLLLHVKARFLLPMMPFLCAYAGSALASLHRPEPGAAVVLQQRWRWWVAALLAALLLGLALLGPEIDGACAVVGGAA